MNRNLLFVALFPLLAACNLDSGHDGSTFGVHGGTKLAAFDCETRAASDPATADTSLTPRADGVAEILALEASGEFTAPEDIYVRVNAELTGLQARFPDAVAGPDSCLVLAGRTDELTVGMTDTAFAEAINGSYDDWNALNENLRATVTFSQTFNTALIRFDGLYNANNLVDAYEMLPGVAYAEASHGFSIPEDNESDACLAVRDRFHYYIFDVSSDTQGHTYNGFEVDSSGNIRHLGVHRAGLDSSGEQAPEWFSQLQDCRAFL